MKILVAGGNGLIGSALVEGFRANGADVITADIRGEGEYLDMAEPKTLSIIFEKYRPISGFVNCTYPKDFETATRKWIECTELAAKELSILGGSIVNFGSVYGMVGPQPDIYRDNEIKIPTVEYSFIKGGIIEASKNIAMRYAPRVRVNVVSPGGVYDGQSELFTEKYIKRCPMKRMANPEDMIELVWLLLTDKSSYITGVNLPIDGGWTAW